MRDNGKIDYVELPGGAALSAVKTFYTQAFGWTFTDYGPAYAAFCEGLDGGLDAETTSAKPLVVLYADNLEQMLARVEDTGGKITRPVFSFPGGRRFHFQDPAGNELAMWSAS